MEEGTARPRLMHMASSSFPVISEESALSSRLCALCEAIENLKVCSRCKETWYCSKAHQKQHWKEHKKLCGVTASKESSDRVTRQSCSAAGGSVNDRKKESEKLVVSTPDSRNSLSTETNPLPDEETNLQEDIARFSANLQKKHSYSLTPCDDSVNSKQSEIQFQSAEPNQQRRNMPTNRPSLCEYAVSAIHSRDNRDSSLVRYISEHMRTFGICVVDKFLKPEEGEAIVDEVSALWEDNAFRDGQLVLNRDFNAGASTRDIRGDLITWTDGSDLKTQNIGILISKIDSAVLQCKEHVEGFKNISSRTEAMVACYPGRGTHYVKHVDNPNKDGRCVTCIYYLNKGWDEKTMGGCLRLYPQGHKVVSVEPVFNRLVCFWSDRRNPHEVMPAFNTRYAITVWYLDGVERTKALASATTSK